jgi:hypothetical protein
MPMNPRLLAPRAAGGFDPRKIANCTAWFDANNSSSLTYNGSTVSSWNNLVAGGTNYAQATAANQPQTTTLGGKTAIRLPSSDDICLIGPTVAQLGNTTTNTLIIFFVIQWTGGGANTRRFLTLSGNGFYGTFGWYPNFGGNSFLDFPESSGRVFGSIGSTTLTTAPTICRLRRAGANMSLHYNAAQVASGSSASGALASDTSQQTRLNGQQSGISVACGDMIAFSRDLSASEISTVEKALARKYGVTL